MAKKRKRVDYLIALMFLLNLAAIPFFAKNTIREIADANKILSASAVSEGVIVDTVAHRRKGGYNYHAYIWFLDAAGQEYFFETPSESTGDPSPIGKSVKVIYYQNDPDIAATGNVEKWRNGNLIFGTLMSFFILLPAFFIIEIKREKIF